jgi:poly-gamma-glutamate synthesis protein (capsule biosynthesis protein)
MKRKYFVTIICLFFVCSATSGIYFFHRNGRTVQEPHVDIAVPLVDIRPTDVPVLQNDEAVFIPKKVVPNDLVRDHSWIATLSAQRVRTLVATGDVIPARAVNIETMKHKDFVWPWANILDITKSADISLINLESPLLQKCEPINQGFRFCGDPGHIQGLVAAGIDIANLANNHAGNYGVSGLTETKKLLSNNGIDSTGMGTPTIRTVRGIRFGFLGYNDIGGRVEGITAADPSLIQRDIATLRPNVDVLVVSFHWGIEYAATPSARQVHLAHATIDDGADLIIGNHPHWVQRTENYNGKWITYAHGNTIFDQMWSDDTRIGVIGTYTFYDTTLIDISFTPTKIDAYGQPHVASDVQTYVEKRLLGK